MTKKKIGLAAAFIIIISINFLPIPVGLNAAGRNTLGLLLTALILWITEPIPIGITSLLVLVLQPVLKVATLKNSITGFASPVIFFVIATFGISYAITKYPLAKRILLIILKYTGSNIKYILLAVMFSTMIISSVMSNVPATAVFMGIVFGLLGNVGSIEARKSIGKIFMIAIPFAGMIGGMMTPAGSSLNILALDILKQNTGITISFIQWMVIGIPVALILLPVTWWVLLKIYKPSEMKKEEIDRFFKNTDIPARMQTGEKKVLVIISAMIILWVLSSWIPVFDVTVIAVTGLMVLFLPGVNVLSWNEFSDIVSWDVVLLIGSVISIGVAFMSNGLDTWIFTNVFQLPADINSMALIFALGIFIAALHLPLPIAPAIITVVMLPLISIAPTYGISPAILALPIASFAGCCMLIPLDAVPLLTYSSGYYSMIDMAKSGWIITLIWTVLTAVWVPVSGMILGI
ncbi:MAG: DASS family sodium-coupled anion symporter [Spirochaetes bacterium]|nr:DASS family sodium-coupled anion symporter [Spirochaetota bacterium]